MTDPFEVERAGEFERLELMQRRVEVIRDRAEMREYEATSQDADGSFDYTHQIARH